ncbi:MAG: exosortase/archaeosortase family protein [Thaumarchaeota archaeon]|nr:exosortase/archaeosortase family protein [Nitrososphaerota archaeon]
MSTISKDDCGNLKFRIDFYNPSGNTVTNISGAGETGVFHLQPGVKFYEASWGSIAQNKVLPAGDTLVVSIWCPDCKTPPALLFNSAAHPSNIDFPIVVPENAIALAGIAVTVPAVGGLAMRLKRSRELSPGGPEEDGMRQVQRTLIVSGALIFLTLPLLITFNQFLTSVVMAAGLDKYLTGLVPYEASAASALLRGLGLHAGNTATNVWLSGGFIPVTAFIDWNCSGWQSFLVFGITSVSGLGQLRRRRDMVLVASAGLLCVFAINVLRITTVVMLGYYVGYPAALIFHDYGGTLITLGWLLAFWTFVLGRFARNEN